MKTEPDSRSLDRLALVYTMVDHIQRARRVEDVYEEAVEGLRRVLALDRTGLATQEGTAGMRIRAAGGLAPATRRALAGYSPWPRSERDPRPVVVADLRQDRQDQPVYDALRAEGLRGVVWIPLLHRGRLVGQLLLGRGSPRGFDASELRLAQVIAGHVAFSIWRTQSDEDQAELLRRFEAERSVLESVVRHMPAGVLLADVPGGRIITSNPQIETIWRRPLRHAERVGDYGMWGGLDEDGRPLDPHAWPLARSVERGETVQGEEIRIRRGDGREGIVRMSSAPVVDSRGHQLAAVATVYDVTEDREQERRSLFLEEATGLLNRSLELSETQGTVARLAVEEAGDWAVLYQAEEDRLTRAAAVHRDPALAHTMGPFREGGLSREDGGPAARALASREALHIDDDPDAVLEAMTAGDPSLEEVVRALGCSSVVHYPLVSGDRELGVLAVVCAGRSFGESDLDLLEELSRRAAVALDNARLYERALAADRAKSSFLAVMSHEFRTPLSAILGYADILTAQVHGELNPTQARHLDRVKASVRHLSHLVDEILSFASMEAGRVRITAGRTDARALVADAVDIMEPIAEAAGIVMHRDLPDEPLVLRTDASKLRQVVINLVSNAIKYTPEGQVLVELTPDADGLVLRVTDTGMGIAPEHVERVFEPFWQVEQSDDRRVTGTGLGLTVARQLARLLGGDLVLRSEVGKGSRFTLTLPRLPEPGRAATPGEGAKEAAGAAEAGADADAGPDADADADADAGPGADAGGESAGVADGTGS